MTARTRSILAPGRFAPWAGLLLTWALGGLAAAQTAPQAAAQAAAQTVHPAANPAAAQADSPVSLQPAAAAPLLRPPLQPMSLTSIEAALARPPGEALRAPRTSGTLDLKGKQVYIAEYLLLIDVSGELPISAQTSKQLGTLVSDRPALLAYSARHDIAALQALTDRAWADLQTRLAAAGVLLADAAALQREHGAVYEASAAATTAQAPVLLESRQGERLRRYLAMAPTGMKLVPRSVAGIGLGNLAARLAYPLRRVEGLSLALAINLSALEASAARASGFASPGGQPALSPLMELAPAASAALVHAHAQLALVNLDEALVPAGEFGRLRVAPLDGPIPSNDPLKPLFSIGRRLLGEAAPVRMDALLELDGPATARLMVYLSGAANQAIADALKAAL